MRYDDLKACRPWDEDDDLLEAVAVELLDENVRCNVTAELEEIYDDWYCIDSVWQMWYNMTCKRR